MKYEIHQGDVIKRLEQLPAESFHACFADPPYGIDHLGNNWDHGVPAKEYWGAVHRVLKPGASMLLFGGTRMFHRLACAVEDAGFQIRDQLMWCFLSGYPKSHDLSKAIDKKLGAKRQKIATAPGVKTAYMSNMGNIRPWMLDPEHRMDDHNPITQEAKDWQGYGQNLKPAYESILWSMKRVDRNYVNNALKHGVAGINIDGTRIKGDDLQRWPANLMLSDEAASLLDAQAGEKISRCFFVEKASSEERNRPDKPATNIFGEEITIRNEHPTVKPLRLNEYLATLILPPAGKHPRRLLVPFSGSGSEMVAALAAGWDEVVGVELESDYRNVALRRLRRQFGPIKKG